LDQEKGIGKIKTDRVLNEVLPLLIKRKYNARPVTSDNSAWQTYLTDDKKLLKIKGNKFFM